MYTFSSIIPKSLKCIHSATKIKALFANSIRRFTQDPTRTNLKPEYYRRQWGCRALSQSDEPSNPSVSKDSAKRRRTPKNLGKPYLPNTLPLPPTPYTLTPRVLLFSVFFGVIACQAKRQRASGGDRKAKTLGF